MMRHRDLHPWDVSVERAEEIQRDLQAGLPAAQPLGVVRRAAGAAVRGRGGTLWAAAAVISLPEMEIVESAVASVQARFPYRPGLMAFRVGPAILAAFEGIATRPQVLLFAGHGAAHPRGLGLASHLGALLEVPSVGCADRLLVGGGTEPGSGRGDYSTILDDRGRAIGAWLRTRPGARPVVVSAGYRMSPDDALEVVMACVTGYRLPQPLRAARRLAAGAQD